MPDEPERTFDIDGFLDTRKLRGFHIGIIAILSLVMLVDGYDLFVAGSVIPAISAAWQVKPSALTGVFVCQQAGLLVGVLFTGPLGDRVGRKTVLLGCLAGFGLASFAVSVARTPYEMMALRFISAIFFSGALPNCVALVAEVAPKRLRAGLISIVFCGYSAGQFICAAVLAFIIGPLGWQSAFYVGGILPLLLCPILYFFLPDSLRFYAARDPYDARIPALLRKFDPGVHLTGRERFEIEEPETTRRQTPVLKLFRGSLLPMTLLVWLAYLLAFTANQLMLNWDTTIFHHVANIPYKHFALMLSTRTVLGIIGMATAGFVMDRFGGPRVLAFFFVLGTLALVGMAFSNLGSAGGFFFYAFSGYAMNSALSGLNAQAAATYPSTARVTGVAWGSGFGRIGGMLGPVIGGALLAEQPSTTVIYLVTAVPELLCAITVAAMLLVGLAGRSKSPSRV